MLATSAGGVGSHVRTIAPRAARRRRHRAASAAPPATEELFGFTAAGADFRPGRHLRRARAARRRPRRRRSCAGRPPGADLVHAHGLRAGLVAAAARRLSGRRHRPLVLTLHNALQESSGARAAAAAGGRGADHPRRRPRARRLRRPGRQRPPARRPRRPGGARARPAAAARRALAATRCAPSWALDDGRPLVVAVGRLHPQKGYDVLLDAVARWAADDGCGRPPLVAIAGDGPLEDELADRIRAERLPVAAARPALATSPTCSPPPTSACCPRAGRAARSPRRRRCGPGTPLVATRAGGMPELFGDAADLVPVGDAAALADAVVRVLTDPAHAAELAEAGRAAGRRPGRTRRPPARRWSPSTASCSAPPEAARREPLRRGMALLVVVAHGAARRRRPRAARSADGGGDARPTASSSSACPV